MPNTSVSMEPLSASTPAEPLPRFQVVAIPKLILMIMLSMGSYMTYWYYRQWLLYRQEQGVRLVPLLLCLFGGLLLYPLLTRVARYERDAGRSVDWSPLGITLMLWLPHVALFCAWVLLGMQVQEAGVTPATVRYVFAVAVSVLLCLSLPLVAMVKVQQVINVSQGDSLGRGNATLTVANLVWILMALFVLAACCGRSI